MPRAVAKLWCPQEPSTLARTATKRKKRASEEPVGDESDHSGAIAPSSSSAYDSDHVDPATTGVLAAKPTSVVEPDDERTQDIRNETTEDSAESDTIVVSETTHGRAFTITGTSEEAVAAVAAMPELQQFLHGENSSAEVIQPGIDSRVVTERVKELAADPEPPETLNQVQK
jgi:hypothetical protein